MLSSNKKRSLKESTISPSVVSSPPDEGNFSEEFIAQLQHQFSQWNAWDDVRCKDCKFCPRHNNKRQKLSNESDSLSIKNHSPDLQPRPTLERMSANLQN